jgi:phosphoserine phosphatase
MSLSKEVINFLIILKPYNEKNIFVFGDGSNDLPMLLKTQNSFLVNSKLKGFEPKEYFDSYNTLKEFIEKFTK